MAEGARRLRSSLLSYRDGARLIAGYRPTGASRVNPDIWFGPLETAGFSRTDAIWAMIVVGQFTFGWTMDEQAAQGRSIPAERRLDPNAGFEFGLGAIIEGLQARLAKSKASEPVLEAQP